MTYFLLILLFAAVIFCVVLGIYSRRVEKRNLEMQHQVEQALRDKEETVQNAEQSLQRGLAEAGRAKEAAIADARRLTQDAITHAEQQLAQKLAEADAMHEAVRAHYEAESRQAGELLMQELMILRTELEELRPFAQLRYEQEEVRQVLEEALQKATALQQEAQAVLESSRLAAATERTAWQQKGREMQQRAEAVLIQATRDAGRIIADANRRAQEIGGDAYVALRDKQMLDEAVTAIQNIVNGYGDRYVIPTHSLLDDLAKNFGHVAAGESLRAAREQSRRMVVQAEAAACDYVEESRRTTAIRFVVDAFNGRVDGILSRVKHDNHGTLEQEIRDAFSLVNLNGQAFRNARILPAYLDARLSELKWAVVTQELRLKEREEQRQIQERIRDEEKARREYERAIQETAREEEMIRRAMAAARAEVEHAGVQERVRLEGQLAALGQKLAEAEAKNQRVLSMAQQTRSGHVYVISNIGAFGEEVFKIGMTRRLEPLDRIRELGDASVPFAFDVHAMIYSEDAPGLERLLHGCFDDLRINKVNYRKEFFRLPLQRIRTLVEERGLETVFTMAAEAREYRETVALEKMTPQEREKYQVTLQEEDPADE